MKNEHIDFTVDNQIARITIKRANVFNALNLDAMCELMHIANHCGSDPDIRVVVLTGEGEKAFCAGGDVAAFESSDNVTVLLKEMTTYMHTAVSRFARMNAPLIARINGVAAGAGLSLVGCSDLAICTSNSRFTSAYTAIGLTPDGSSSYFLPRIIGTRRATEMFLTNRTLSASEALDWGLVNQVVEAGELDNAVDALAAQLAKGPTRSHGGIKKLIQMSLNDTLESQMERETQSIVDMSITADGSEGVKAFVEKRKPGFRGR
ncbi:MAG: enoyl-CoA hydratase-related protein [Pseudomonadota bacterium]